MQHFLNLVSSVALLVWGTHLVRSGILRAFGNSLRHTLARNLGTPLNGLIAGIGVTALTQSSTATALIVSSFVGQRLIPLSMALTVMLGADIGTSLVTLVFSFGLSWLSPLLILIGVILFISRQATKSGRFGRVLIGLGLMLLALRLISESAVVIVQSEAVAVILDSLRSDLLMEITIGALLTLITYSSLAIVLLTAALTSSGAIPVDVGIGLVLGANLGSGFLAVVATSKAKPEVRQVPIGNLIFKIIGVALAVPLVSIWLNNVLPHINSKSASIVMFHLCLNLAIAILFLFITVPFAKLIKQWMPRQSDLIGTERPKHLDASALNDPARAISCAAREALYQADLVETMLRGVHKVFVENDLKLSKDLRKMDDRVDQLYRATKSYLTRVSRQTLNENERKRWAHVMAFTINLEQVADIAERILQDIEERKIKKNRVLSAASMREISDLHSRLLINLGLAMSVFLSGSVIDSKKLLAEKVAFRNLALVYSSAHIDRLAGTEPENIDTSSLHLDLINALKLINSHLCSIAYPILEFEPITNNPGLPKSSTAI